MLFETRKQMCDVLYIEVYEGDCGNEISLSFLLLCYSINVCVH